MSRILRKASLRNPSSHISPTNSQLLGPTNLQRSKSCQHPSPTVSPPFARPTAAVLGTAESGIILPKRKDAANLWLGDDPHGEEPNDLQRSRSCVMVAGWLNSGYGRDIERVGSGVQDATDGDIDPHKLSTSDYSTDVSHSQDLRHERMYETTSSRDSIDSAADNKAFAGQELHKSVRSSPIGALAVTEPLVEPTPMLSGPLAAKSSSTTRRVSFIRRPSLFKTHTGSFLSTSTSSPAGLSSFASSDASTVARRSHSKRRNSMLSLLFTANRQSGAFLPDLTVEERAEVDKLMVSPTIYTAGSIVARVGVIEDEEERRLAELAFMG